MARLCPNLSCSLQHGSSLIRLMCRSRSASFQVFFRGSVPYVAVDLVSSWEESLSHCELITDDGILHLSNSTCGHERLRVLELDNCLLITDVALEHLENCRGLERLELYDCQQVTRAGIKRMRAQLPHVKVHAYFAPVTPPTAVGGSGQRLCRCCVIL
uniref:F-box/LRR-repeat protein 2 n=1 Tax=Equus asinus TaxID=9793 RepID=A0A9L0IWF3_EQUAS